MSTFVTGGCATFGHSCYGGMGKRMSPADLLTNEEVMQDVQQDNNPGIIFTGPRGDVGFESERKISVQDLYNLSPFFRQWATQENLLHSSYVTNESTTVALAIINYKTMKFNYDEAFEVVDLDSAQSKQYLDLFGEEIDVFDMTSLSTLILLSQTESKSSHTVDLETNVLYTDPKHRLSLAYEKLHRMPKLLLNELSPVIKTLDISHNEFENIEFVAEIKHLTMLICDHNNITSMSYIPYMPQLELLWMNHCKISELYPWAKKLQQACPNLRHLSLMGNPAAPSYLNGGTFYEYLQYRLFMISLFPTLVHLDDKAVTDDQRAEAYRLYKRPLLERIASKAPSKLPNYFRSVADKVTEILTPIPFALTNQRNVII
ncbi:hypothetical protein FQA39_LY00763 [Lamprigera yunnana]|nr:hypothetical protein FQA39_LY00763 [Lamprigera yunnana]